MLNDMLLVCDTDCLLQVFISNQTALLKWLRTNYGLDAIIVPEVDAELAWNTAYKDRFDADLRKALAQGVIALLDYSRPEVQLSSFSPAQATTAVREILKTGHAYSAVVGRGEAYSHAACVHLGTPLLSHDISAIQTLLRHQHKTAAPVLRFYDLIVLAYNKGGIGAQDCKKIRQALDRLGEWQPRVFARSSFAAGLPHYNPRLHDRADYVGTPPLCQNYDDLFYLSHK